MRVTALDAAGVARREVWSWRSVTASAQKVTWAGKIERDGKLVAGPEGRYALVAELRDAAGNVNEQRREVTIDRTLSFARPAPPAFSPNGDGIRDSVALAFKLTRKATVNVVVTSGGDTLRTFKLGELAAGSRKAAWNGKVAGEVVAAGRYRYTVTAESAVGVVTASAPVDVDLARPKLEAPKTAAVALGGTAKVGVTVADADSAQVDLWCRVTDAKGRVVTTVRRGLVGGARTTNVSWKPPARGVYTLTFCARDPGGNREQAPARTTLTVR
jgi:flagellar hook assembly protein FlgD